MNKEKEVMQEIKKFAVQKCSGAFGFAGVAESDDKIIINSGGDKDLKITIEVTEQ